MTRSVRDDKVGAEDSSSAAFAEKDIPSGRRSIFLSFLTTGSVCDDKVTAGRREIDRETLQGGTERDLWMAFWKEVGPKTSGFIGDGNSKESGWGVEGRGGEAATWRGGHRRRRFGRVGRE
uniref:Uncharacterized protein n=1 Tax=Chromera velia CCMP2878 TaxID=1169474 RepID=A0A0G4I5W6_9ALVE|eukprot:Cvel_11215.t1-p1 / transcript=Cvel_11215.t1 / gene=Cvel_11215 / organism=Chromera_velia_CCMP2878 / gene_product=hypothetical protein / transcript_product=hypothetical protein / location=Cvel_scaffold697:52595-64873(-) / protein_length=120 / sequence_SO=supercontig / SO=protein_coding / is_pseudo=false